MTKSFVLGLSVTMELLSFFSSPLAILVSTLAFIGVLKIIAIAYNQCTYWKKRGIPEGGLIIPGLGSTWKLWFQLTNFFDYFKNSYDHDPKAKYLGMMDLATPLVYLRDPEIIKDILVKDFDHFMDHQNFVHEDAEWIFSKNLFSLRGNLWREMRNTLSPSFTASKMKVMFELVSKCSREFTEYLADHPEECSSINTKEAFRRYTTDVIATSAFGISVNSMKNRDNEFFKRGLEAATSFNSGSMLKFMFLRLAPRLAKVLNITLFPAGMPEFFTTVVSETIKVREEQNIVRPDMIHLLMQARNKEGPTDHKLTLQDIVAQAFIFFFAGFDTSSTLMCFVAHELAVNPDIQKRLQEEVDKHFAEGKGEITYETVSKMTYMDMVLSEALRKYPPGVFTDRFCVKDYELPPAKPGLKSVILKANSVVWIPTYWMHHDPAYFPDPSKFDPERFSDENKDNIVPYTYMPFGLGPRMCIGNRFALMETKLLIAHLLHKFNFKATEKTMDPIVLDKTKFELIPKEGFWITLETRNK